MIARKCKQCGEQLRKSSRETTAAFNARDYCNKSCFNQTLATQLRNAKSIIVATDASDVRYCIGCGEVLKRHPGERPARFIGRISCGRACAPKARNVGFDTINVEHPAAASARRLRKALFIKRLDVVTRELFVDALEQHPDLLLALAKREFDSSSAPTSVAHSGRQ